jgi:lysophospholipase L1-like esterase
MLSSWNIGAAAAIMPHMRALFATAALSPLLIAQALYVRRVTPRLPEPDGERSGADGAGTPLRVLIAGDSAAAGVGVEAQASALSGCLVESLARDHRVQWRLIARSGYTIAHLIEVLEQHAPEPFDVAAVSIGVNDVLGLTRLQRWQQRTRHLVALLAARFAVRRVLLCAIPPLQDFPALPQPLAWALGRRAARLNATSREALRDDAHARVVQPTFALEHGAMASDGFHPGAAAYRLIARDLASAIRGG